jgi:hypothetical protein
MFNLGSRLPCCELLDDGVWIPSSGEAAAVTSDITDCADERGMAVSTEPCPRGRGPIQEGEPMAESFPCWLGPDVKAGAFS